MARLFWASRVSRWSSRAPAEGGPGRLPADTAGVGGTSGLEPTEPERTGAHGESRANRQPIGILNAERNPSRQAAAEPRRLARLARRPTLTPSALFAPAFVGPGGREG